MSERERWPLDYGITGSLPHRAVSIPGEPVGHSRRHADTQWPGGRPSERLAEALRAAENMGSGTAEQRATIWKAITTLASWEDAEGPDFRVREERFEQHVASVWRSIRVLSPPESSIRFSSGQLPRVPFDAPPSPEVAEGDLLSKRHVLEVDEAGIVTYNAFPLVYKGAQSPKSMTPRHGGCRAVAAAMRHGARCASMKKTAYYELQDALRGASASGIRFDASSLTVSWVGSYAVGPRLQARLSEIDESE